MTETTASGPMHNGTGHGGTGAPRGLTIRRIYTREGVHPYDEVTWERRDVVMTNWRDGSVNFEQRGVEFPDFWSVNAANIVTTKYFRGAVGAPQRETSLRQLIDRVVGVYVSAGRENGYFASAKDAEVFEHELKYALGTRSSASTPRSGSTWAPRPRSRYQRVSSLPWTTQWTPSWSGTGKRG